MPKKMIVSRKQVAKPKAKLTPERDWRSRIETARKRGYFTVKELRDASGWFSCACGKLHPSIPRNMDWNGEPVDRNLSRLGSEFYDHVQHNNFSAALECVGEIEVREKVLLQRTRGK